ncbi:MAG: CpaF family protein, partial [Actinobacteria bacterium]|nr:CpaF family protein [Actinomycetota bacterium]
LPRGVIDTHLERILSPLGRRLDRLSPMVDARLADGTRVCAVIPPIAVTGTCAAFRLFRQRIHPLDSFADSPDALRELRCCDGNILVTGSTGSGKTSLVASLLANCPVTERTVVIEDTHELPLRSGHTVRLEARPPNAEGRGSVSLDDLLRTALRLRPDRIVVGEIRGPEALTFVQPNPLATTICPMHWLPSPVRCARDIPSRPRSWPVPSIIPPTSLGFLVAVWPRMSRYRRRAARCCATRTIGTQ